MWFINRFSEYKQMGFGLTVSLMDDERREVKDITAEADISARTTSTGFFWKEDSQYAAEDGELLRTLPFEKLETEELGDDPNLMLLGERQDLSFLELKKITDNFSIMENPRFWTTKFGCML